MSDIITITGTAGTDPRHITTSSGLDITSFRIATGGRRFDRDADEWVDTESNWYTVTAFRHLALNLAASLHRGERVIVTGTLRVRPWENGEKSGITVEIEATSIGHDLAWGTTEYTRGARPDVTPDDQTRSE